MKNKKEKQFDIEKFIKTTAKEYTKRFRMKIGQGKNSFYSYPAQSVEIGGFFSNKIKEAYMKALSLQKQEIVEEIERMKYIDKDFIEQDGMEEIGMKTRNLIIDQVLNQLNQKLTK